MYKLPLLHVFFFLRFKIMHMTHHCICHFNVPSIKDCSRWGRKYLARIKRPFNSLHPDVKRHIRRLK